MRRDRELFVLDMGQPVRILDMANEFVRLHGLEPGRDVEVRITGLRPGEKLVEKLHYDHESPTETRHPQIRRCQIQPPSREGQDAQGVRQALAEGDTGLAVERFYAMFPGLARGGDALRSDSKTQAFPRLRPR